MTTNGQCSNSFCKKSECKNNNSKNKICENNNRCGIKEPETLYRYVDSLTAVQILQEKKLYFSNPMLWEDKNDSHSVLKYKEYKKLDYIGVLCFTTSNERHHYWSTYVHKEDCIRLKFKLGNLELTEKKFIKGHVKYKCINCPDITNANKEELIFLKRRPFIDEGEYRIISSNKNEYIKVTNENKIEVSISPYMPEHKSKFLKSLIKEIHPNIKTSKSQLNNFKNWQNKIDKITNKIENQNST